MSCSERGCRVIVAGLHMRHVYCLYHCHCSRFAHLLHANFALDPYGLQSDDGGPRSGLLQRSRGSGAARAEEWVIGNEPESCSVACELLLSLTLNESKMKLLCHEGTFICHSGF